MLPPETETQECLRLLHEIDADEDITVTSWEAEWLSSVFQQTHPFTARQIAMADILIDKYYQ